MDQAQWLRPVILATWEVRYKDYGLSAVQEKDRKTLTHRTRFGILRSMGTHFRKNLPYYISQKAGVKFFSYVLYKMS
jgi:hypothetical protein